MELDYPMNHFQLMLHVYRSGRLSHESLPTHDTRADNQNAEETSAFKKQYCTDLTVITLLLLKLPICVTHNLDIRVQKSQKKKLKREFKMSFSPPLLSHCHKETSNHIYYTPDR